VVVAKELVEEVNGLARNVALVLRGDKLGPGLALVAAKKVVELRVEVDVVSLKAKCQLILKR